MRAVAVCSLRSNVTLPTQSEPSDATAPAATPAPGVLDAQALARLQELDPGGKAGLLARVLATYTLSLQRLLEQWRGARAGADTQGLRHVAHTLKSSSASVGALKLSELCADIERRLREGTTQGLDAELDALSDEGERVLAALSPPQNPNS